MIKRAFHLTYKAARRIVIGVVGATVLLLGLVMIVTPGPALVVIPVGLAILWGAPKSGKTFLALQFARSLAAGEWSAARSRSPSSSFASAAATSLGPLR